MGRGPPGRARDPLPDRRGVRYLAANGNPRAVEEGKNAIKSALIGYALAALYPMLVDILRRVLGT